MDGTLVMGFRDGTVELRAGDMIVIPRGVEHRPSSVAGHKALLIEPEGVPNTGGVRSDLAVQNVEWV
jgi:mannose-6-phosphate isomerase-like protein (cupin superfamily)